MRLWLADRAPATSPRRLSRVRLRPAARPLTRGNPRAGIWRLRHLAETHRPAPPAIGACRCGWSENPLAGPGERSDSRHARVDPVDHTDGAPACAGVAPGTGFARRGPASRNAGRGSDAGVWLGDPTWRGPGETGHAAGRLTHRADVRAALKLRNPPSASGGLGGFLRVRAPREVGAGRLVLPRLWSALRAGSGAPPAALAGGGEAGLLSTVARTGPTGTRHT